MTSPGEASSSNFPPPGGGGGGTGCPRVGGLGICKDFIPLLEMLSFEGGELLDQSFYAGIGCGRGKCDDAVLVGSQLVTQHADCGPVVCGQPKRTAREKSLDAWRAYWLLSLGVWGSTSGCSAASTQLNWAGADVSEFPVHMFSIAEGRSVGGCSHRP